MITKLNGPTKNGVDKGAQIAREFEKLCKVGGIHNYSTMNETKAAFAERTKQSLKNVRYNTWKIMDITTFKTCLSSSQP